MRSNNLPSSVFSRDKRREAMSGGSTRSRTFSLVSRAILLAMSVVSVAWFSPVSLIQAQGVLIDEVQDRFHLPRIQPDRPTPPVASYAITEFSVDASIKEQVATTQVTQVFKNTGSVTMEARFIFPLPYEGAVDQMTFMVDGTEYEAKLLDAGKAREIYQGYLRRNQDPALLQWIGTGLFQTSVFPIPPGATRKVTLRYSQLLRRDGTMTDYWFPLSTARYTSVPIEKLSIRVSIADQASIQNVYSPTHPIELQRDDQRHVVVTTSQSAAVPNQDFRLVYDTAKAEVAASLLSAWPADDDQGYFALLASPAFDLKDVQPTQKRVFFVVDQSGSMSGQKIDQAREAAKFVLQNLRPDDQFNLISYNSNVSALSPEMLRYDDETRAQALGFINGITAGGMTNIDSAFQSALAQMTDKDTPSYVVFLSDGMPTAGEKNELKIAARCREANQAQARIISFGVGFDVNSRLLDRISRENSGQTEYVLPNEDLEAAVARLYSKISAPVVTQMKIEYTAQDAKVEDGPLTNRVYPENQTELYAGSQLVIVGRYRQSGPTKIKIQGLVGDAEQTFEFDLRFAEKGEQDKYPFVSKLWAMRRIGELIDQLDLEGKNQELIDEMIALSLKHGIVTPYTSYLADDQAAPEQLADRGLRRRATVDSLSTLEAASCAEGFSGRSFKQQNKLADNLQGLSERNAQGLSFGAPNSAIAPGQLGGGFSSGGGPVEIEKLSRVTEQGVRQVGAVTLYKRSGVLIAENAASLDLEKEKDKIVIVERFSEAWFDLVAKNSDLENLILSEQREDEELVVKLRDQYYRIR